eukprot:4032092-Amphidinium_carterae.1
MNKVSEPYDEDGHAYLNSAAGTQWCDDVVLEVCVFAHPSQHELWIEERNGNRISLAAYKQRLTYIAIPFKLCTAALEIEIGTYVLKQPVGGTQVLFALHDWHKHLLGSFSKLPFNRWVNSWWPWWVKTLEHHGLQHEHLGKAKQMTGVAQSPYECFENITLSLPATLLLFSKWAGHSKGKTKDCAAREAWMGGLKSLVQRFMDCSSETQTFVFCLDTSVIPQMGLPLEGSNRVACRVTGTRLDLSPNLLFDVMPVRHAIANSKCSLSVDMDCVNVLVLHNVARSIQ